MSHSDSLRSDALLARTSALKYRKAGCVGLARSWEDFALHLEQEAGFSEAKIAEHDRKVSESREAI